MCRGGEGGRLGTAEVSVSFRLSTLHANAAEGLLGLYLTFKIEKYQNVKHIRIPTVSKRKGNSTEKLSASTWNCYLGEGLSGRGLGPLRERPC